MNSSAQIRLDGHVLIEDAITGEVVLDKKNAIHPQNMAYGIARSLSRETSGTIYKMCFGNGGTFYNSGNVLVYRPPNTIGDATLYNQTYDRQVDEQSVGTPTSNYVKASVSPEPSISSVITIFCQLNANEPGGQAADDNDTTDPESAFTFDELGVKTSDGKLLTHVIFSPIEKTANRAFFITYTITVSCS
jgi:hypothetical protein